MAAATVHTATKRAIPIDFMKLRLRYFSCQSWYVCGDAFPGFGSLWRGESREDRALRARYCGSGLFRRRGIRALTGNMLQRPHLQKECLLQRGQLRLLLGCQSYNMVDFLNWHCRKRERAADPRRAPHNTF